MLLTFLACTQESSHFQSPIPTKTNALLNANIFVIPHVLTTFVASKDVITTFVVVLLVKHYLQAKSAADFAWKSACTNVTSIENRNASNFANIFVAMILMSDSFLQTVFGLFFFCYQLFGKIIKLFKLPHEMLDCSRSLVSCYSKWKKYRLRFHFKFGKMCNSCEVWGLS